MCLSLSEGDHKLLTKVVNKDADVCDFAVERCVQVRRRIEMMTALNDQSCGTLRSTTASH